VTGVKRPLYLCAGLQSSGSTLASWCFLQRRDMNGILDGRGDVLPEIPEDLPVPYTWAKFTITAFRLRDMILRYEDEGWDVHPLLIVRDVRAVFNSLIAKPYGRNGITAEEPPLRLRLLRFKEDWELFHAHRWPVISYENLIADPEGELRRTCAQLGLSWDPAMLTWPKRSQDIAFPCNGNETFLKSRGRTCQESIQPELARLKVDRIPSGDLAWLEREFETYNISFGYPTRALVVGAHAEGERVVPSFQNTRRYRRLQRKNLLTWVGQFIPFVGRHWRMAYLRCNGLR